MQRPGVFATLFSHSRRHRWKVALKKRIVKSRVLTLPFDAAFALRMRQNRALPGALVIGGQKCGSTSLYAYLEQHPQLAGVHMYPAYDRKAWVKKEVHYFNHERMYQRGARWYRAHFDLPKPGVINFEATPAYLNHPDAPQRVHELLPEAKFIVSLRDPVTRAFSAYHHMLKATRSEETFRECLEREFRKERSGSSPIANWDVLREGRYDEGFARWFALYPREQFHIIDFRDLVNNPGETVAGIITFLGLPPAPIDTGRTFNEGRYSERMEPDLEERLREYYEPHNRRLEALLGYSMGW